MKNKHYLAYGIIALLFIEAVVFTITQFTSHADAQIPVTKTVAVKSVSSQIAADGSVTAQDQATLHFQTSGKLVSLPLKEGDAVTEGQTIAQLDTYALQRALTTALNNYRSTRDTFDQAQQNKDKNITQNYQGGSLNFYGAGLPKYGSNGENDTYLDDVAKRIVDENQANLDNSVIGVEVANYALQMATLTSPLTGIVTHEDVTVAGQNITTSTSFTVADPSTVVFRAMVPDYQIDYVSEGAKATIYLDGKEAPLSGTVVKIYPSKITTADKQNVYEVDIQTTRTKDLGKLDQKGTVLITSNAKPDTILIPAWTVLSGKYVWVSENNKPVLKTVKTGKIHGTDIEILGGLTTQDKVITDPKYIPEKEYPLL